MPSKKRVKKINLKSAKKSAKAKSAPLFRVPATRAMPAPDGSRFALYVYWFIILFFVAATCYILGRSYSIIHNNAEITEAAILNVSGMPAGQRAAMAAEYAASGKAKLLSGNATGAVLDLTVAIEADPNSADALVLRGEAFMQQSDYGRAYDDLTAAFRIDPDNSVALFDRAMVFIRQENFEAAMEDLNLALAANMRRPSDVLPVRDILAKRAQLRLWAKEWQAAAEDYTAAINASNFDYNPDDFAGRAEAFIGLAEYGAAATDLMAAITVISEKIQTVESMERREQMSRAATAYFEKSAALHVKMNDMASARSDLEAAHTLAATLGDTDTANRLQSLILKL